MTAPGYRRGRCEVTGKAQYTTRRVAKRVAKSFGDDAKAFKCQACGWFHNGHLKNLTRAEHREYHQKKAENATKNPEDMRIFDRIEAAPEVLATPSEA